MSNSSLGPNIILQNDDIYASYPLICRKCYDSKKINRNLLKDIAEIFSGELLNKYFDSNNFKFQKYVYKNNSNYQLWKDKHKSNFDMSCMAVLNNTKGDKYMSLVYIYRSEICQHLSNGDKRSNFPTIDKITKYLDEIKISKKTIEFNYTLRSFSNTHCISIPILCPTCKDKLFITSLNLVKSNKYCTLKINIKMAYQNCIYLYTSIGAVNLYEYTKLNKLASLCGFVQLEITNKSHNFIDLKKLYDNIFLKKLGIKIKNELEYFRIQKFELLKKIKSDLNKLDNMIKDFESYHDNIHLIKEIKNNNKKINEIKNDSIIENKYYSDDYKIEYFSLNRCYRLQSTRANIYKELVNSISDIDIYESHTNLDILIEEIKKIAEKNTINNNCIIKIDDKKKLYGIKNIKVSGTYKNTKLNIMIKKIY